MTAIQPTTASAILACMACSKASCACHRAAKAGHGDTHCPAHDDRNPSLSVSEERAQVLFNCHSGCSQSKVFDALRGLGFFQPQVHVNGTSRNGATPIESRFAYVWPGHGTAEHVRIDYPDKPKPDNKRMWWEPKGVHVRMEELPLYQPVDLTTRPDELVLVCEGEKKTDAAIAHGFLAVSVPGGSGQKNFGTALDVLRDRDLILLPDNDAPGHGLMLLLTGLLAGKARSVRTIELPGLPPKGDVADYFAAGHTADELRALLAAAPVVTASAPKLPKPKKARDLQIAGLPEIGFAVGGILPEGVTLCAGRPKQGKSFLALNLAIAVAAGGKALGDLPVTQGDVLYLTLEGGEHGFLPRLNTMLNGELAPESLEYETDWPRLDDGGADLIAAWLTGHPKAKLIVIDTLGKVRAPTNNKSGIYEQDYAAVQSLVQLALMHHVAILLIHHTRKAVADDPLDTVSGSTGLTGAVDAVWILQRVRGQNSATLTVSGRNLPDDDLGLEWDDRLFTWSHAGDASDVKRSAERRAILQVFADSSESVLSAQAVADILDHGYDAVRKTMTRMAASGELISTGRGGSGYRLATTSNEVSHVSHQSQVSHVSQVSHLEGTEGTNETHGTWDTRTRDPARASIEHPEDEPPIEAAPPLETGPLCPSGCGIQLRDNWCPVCAQTFEESP